MNNKINLAVIGPGNVGLTLALLAERSGHYQVRLGARAVANAEAALREYGVTIPVMNPQAAVADADLVLLTVSDQSITEVCEQLTPCLPANAVVAHCSGALSSDALAKARCVASVASMHPLQTFPNVAAGVKKLPGTYCYWEGDEAAAETIANFCAAVALQPISIEKAAKPLYHAAAVMACNYLSALMDASLELAEAAGIDRDTMWQSLEPMVSATVANIGKDGPAQALTGPITRGDIDTVKSHLQAMGQSRDGAGGVAKVYAAMGQRAARMAKENGSIDVDTAKDIVKLLE